MGTIMFFDSYYYSIESIGKYFFLQELVESLPIKNKKVRDLFTYYFIDIDETTDASVERNFPNHQSFYNSLSFKIERPPKV